MELVQKLQIKPGGRTALLGQPPELRLDLAGIAIATDTETADAVLAFVRVADELDGVAAAALAAARDDRLAWIAYPKAGQMGTDLNRDRLAAAAGERGLRPVRQVSIDAIWSALRFRPL